MYMCLVWKLQESCILIRRMQVALRLLLVSGGPQGQNYGVSNLQHGLQDGSHHDEEDDAEEESSVNDLQLNEPSLNSQDQQSDTLRHAPENQMRKHSYLYTSPCKKWFWNGAL